MRIYVIFFLAFCCTSAVLISDEFTEAFENMKYYYLNEFEDDNSDDFIQQFEKILSKDSLHVPTLINYSYYLLSRNDSVNIKYCYKLLMRLRRILPNDPLILSMEIKFYERLVYLRFLELEDYSFPLCLMAEEKLKHYSRKVFKKFSASYFIRMNTLPYLSFKTFKERENFLITTVLLLENEQIKSKLNKNIENFIERYATEPTYFRNITNLHEQMIIYYIVSFYKFHYEDNYFKIYLNNHYNLNYKKENPIEIQIDKYPDKYQDKIMETLDEFYD